MKFFIVFVLSASMSVFALADSAIAEGEIKNEWFIYQDGNLFFTLSAATTNSKCAIENRWAFDTTRTTGRPEVYAAFLMAYSAGKRIKVVGYESAACTHGNTQTVSEIHVGTSAAI